MSSEDSKEHNGGGLEHSATHDTENSFTDEKKELSQQQTLSRIDVENKAAFKGDDSDGLVEWNLRNIIASIFLCMLYTGTNNTTSTHT